MNAKRKGNAGENKFANWLQSQGIKAYKNGSSGGNAWKSDIHNGLGLNIEVKTCKRLNLQEAWRQTDRDAGLARSTPLLAVHFDGMRENEWLIVQHSSDWIEDVKDLEGFRASGASASAASFERPQDRAIRFELERLKAQAGKVLRLLD